MNCKTCGAALSDKFRFCPGCGETAHPHRLDMKHVLHEFVHGLLHADKGIFLLVKDLVQRPGKAALEYVQGSRKKYFNPVSFLLIAGGLTFFLRRKLAFTEGMGSQRLTHYVSEFLHQFTTPIIVLTIPLLSLYSWLLFKSSVRNYAENMVMNMYMMGEYHLFSIIAVVLPAYFFPQFNYLFIGLGFLIMAVYYYFSCINFFKQSAGVTIFKVIAAELLFLLSFGTAMAAGLVYYLIRSGLHVKDLK